MSRPSVLTFYVFDEGALQGTFTKGRSARFPRSFPSTSYIYALGPWQAGEWFRSDLTPVLLEDVPKEYRAMLLLLI